MPRIPCSGLFPLVLILLVGLTACTSQSPPAPTEPPPQTQPPGPTEPPEATDPKLTRVAEGLTRPLHASHAGDGSGRLFLMEQPGLIRVLKNGELMREPFMDLTSKVNSRSNEQGLLGLAFAPDYKSSGLFYVHHTGSKGETVIARYRVDPATPERGDPTSEEILLTVNQPYANHNGGAIAFGPDGYLYIALGDGGSGGDPQNHAQNLDSLLGKLLRIDVSQPGAYRIPSDNPFVGQNGRDEIWAYGLRNPWRTSFDQATGDLYIADVGQNQIEEVNFQPAGDPGGRNYGWRIWEGNGRYTQGAAPDAVFPVFAYTHAEGGCSITGGYVYRGDRIPGLVGAYLYGDYCSGKVWAAQQQDGQWESQLLLESGLRISAFGQDEQGEVYVVDHGGQLFRIDP